MFDIEAHRKLYKRWWYESVYSGSDMDRLLDEIDKLQKALEQFTNFNTNLVGLDAHKEVGVYKTAQVVRNIARKALEE